MRWQKSVVAMLLVGLAVLECSSALAQGVIISRQQPPSSSYSRGADSDDDDARSSGDVQTRSGNNCVSLSRTPAGNDVYITNRCNRAIIVKFCWDSRSASCSCSKSVKCGTGRINPGGREMVTGPGHNGEAIMHDSVCDYKEWAAGRCRL